MCGLVLVVTKNKNGFNQQQQEVFDTLLYLSGHFRGRDGAGIVSVDNLGNVKLAKGALTVDEAMRTKEYAEVQAAAFSRGWALFGHNRSATKGSITDENSHPFVVDDNIVLVHNGTFNGDHKSIKDTAVDSEAIAHVLADKETSVEHALRKINAAYALIWYNVEQRKLNIVRNMARPLWYMETHDSYIYASEEPFLQFVKMKFKLNITRLPFEIKEFSLSTYELDDKKDTTFTSTDIDSSYWKHNTVVTQTTSGTPFRHYQGNGSVPSGVGGRHHPYANAYAWGMDDEDNDGFVSPLALPAPKPTPAVFQMIMDTRSMEMKERVIKHLGTQIKEGMKYAAWEAKQREYIGVNKVKVAVHELVEADDNPRTDNFLMIGRTMNKDQLPVVFPMRGVNFERVMAMADEAVFEIDYSGITWNRVDQLPIPTGAKLEDWDGFALLHGVNPQPIYMSKENASVN